MELILNSCIQHTVMNLMTAKTSMQARSTISCMVNCAVFLQVDKKPIVLPSAGDAVAVTVHEFLGVVDGRLEKYK